MTRQRRITQKIKPLEDLKILHPQAAGLDIRAREILASVPPASASDPVRMFGTFTGDLYALVDWLVACGIETVAMESTGVYWIPIFELLETRGLQVYLVNSWHLKHVPGRTHRPTLACGQRHEQSDVLACQWIQQLHSLGLLRSSFRPDAEMCTLRSLLGHRATSIEHRSPHILHLQKALVHSNSNRICNWWTTTLKCCASATSNSNSASPPSTPVGTRLPNCRSCSEPSRCTTLSPARARVPQACALLQLALVS